MNQPAQERIADTALSVRDLRVSFHSRQGPRQVVRGISFDLVPGEIVGLVGESGCGKSVTAAALMGMAPAGGQVSAQHILLGGKDLSRLDEPRLRACRGREISMIFQEPTTALDPVFTIGSQLVEVIRRHRDAGRSEARAIATGLLESVDIADARRIMRAYPHQLSGGMRQRVMIAMAMTARPGVLIADEPTSSLDVTTQAQVLRQLDKLRRVFGTAILLITHDLGIVAQSCERALVMNDGRIVEQAPVSDLFARPGHPYTEKLLAAVPRLEAGGEPARAGIGEDAGDGLLQVRDLVVRYPAQSGPAMLRRDMLTAVNGVSLEVEAGTIFGLVGESGSGKTTLAQSILQLVKPRSGEILFRGQALSGLRPRSLKNVRRDIQYVFQDPMASLSPRRSAAQNIREPLDHFRIGDSAQRMDAVVRALEQVGLNPALKHRYPHELSGGQRQRVALARAVVCRPDLIIADEPVSSLDVSVQARIIELIRELRDELGIAFLFVSHDLAVIQQLADRVGVMYLGRMMENAPAGDLFGKPAHPYTQALLEAVPVPDPARRKPGIVLKGEVPSALTPPAGCVFHTRCPSVMEQCKNAEPAEIAVNHRGEGAAPTLIRCHLYDS